MAPSASPLLVGRERARSMRIGTTFVILGLGLAAGAAIVSLQTGVGLWWFLAWPASSFLLVGLAYLGLGPGLFGKTPAGRLPWLRIVALLPFFALTWLVWHLLRRRPLPAYHLAAPRLYIGRRLIGEELPPDVRRVVDLTAEFPVSTPIRDGVVYETLPILDGYVPPDDALVALAVRLAAVEEPVYVHCAQGHGRAALVTAAVLVARGLCPGVAEAEAQLVRLRPGVLLTGPQRALLRRVEPWLVQDLAAAGRVI